ncbi:MAG: hypothetical protein COU46_01530 [Candidatus Niyogibacteria bacterium CG10_big_fil_rev_8_21_14_0_10_42_19]|uniref:UDP-N-acetylglucosamine--N-acetylmuramyl-(pentapeptide) pyrophosphoryl-undecaprenol N-acetylglucosamine transferase n=1 Tax=Candidatus Niyogibacteria bacterium CG10_big_fil_rev_8_21_14_0_10_42_19 TaxID=1974725 RepID=A0A2H0THF2_9BACT|nr:MAG: hypothetical protein COU46_01530 [Candidatus Niyogibacteria bacterium CG10_big_fil_rev_8_21_14_0_10_42_19]
MKILFAGGGTGGHFYPIIAVANSIRRMADEQNIIHVDMVLYSTKPYDKDILKQHSIEFRNIPAGKVRRYFSILNFFDLFSTGIGIIKSLWGIFLDIPDVVFAKGGYASFPPLLAAKLFKIPTIIHESDVVPGKVNLWASKFADRIAISFPETIKYFPKNKTALVGHPIRRTILSGTVEAAISIFELEKDMPTILVIGGSQGSQRINEIVLDIMPELVNKAQVIHQTGFKNLKDVRSRASVALKNNPHQSRYHTVDFLNENELRNASTISKLVISRAGAGAIFNIAAWAKPSILIPIQDSAQDHQRQNAYSYARTGAAQVIEEANLSPHILSAEIDKIFTNEHVAANMSKAAEAFSRIDAADKTAKEILSLALEHSS